MCILQFIRIIQIKARKLLTLIKNVLKVNGQKTQRRYHGLRIINDDATKDVREIFNSTGESLLMNALHKSRFPEYGMSSPSFNGCEQETLNAVKNASWKEADTDEENCRVFVTSDIPGGKTNVVDIETVPDDTLFLIEAIGIECDFYEDILKQGCTPNSIAFSIINERPHPRWQKKAFVLTVSDIPATDTKETSLYYYESTDEEGVEYKNIEIIPGSPECNRTITAVDSKKIKDFRLKEMSIISRQQALEIGFETALVGSRANTFISYYKEKRKMSQRPSGYIYQADLLNVDLSDRSFSEYDFSRTKLTDVNMQKASLHDASFRYSELGRVNLNGAYTKRADFMSSSLFDVKMMGGDFSESLFNYASIGESVLRGANFKGASLVKTLISYSDLTGANLRGANLVKADFRNSRCFNVNFKKAVLRKAKFARTDLRCANFKNADLRGANLIGARLEGACFDGADLRGAVLDGACGFYISFKNAIMDKASLRSVRFGNCIMKNARLRDANLKMALLDDANMKGADLSDAKMDLSALNGACMTDCILKNVDLTNAEMCEASLKRAVMNMANLSGTDLGEADLSKASLIWTSLTKASLSLVNADEADFSYAHMEKTSVDGARFRRCNFNQTRLYDVDLNAADMEDTCMDNIDWTSDPCILPGITKDKDKETENPCKESDPQKDEADTDEKMENVGTVAEAGTDTCPEG